MTGMHTCDNLQTCHAGVCIKGHKQYIMSIIIPFGVGSYYTCSMQIMFLYLLFVS